MQDKDAQWLNSLFSLFQTSHSTSPMEWSGFNCQLARESTEMVKHQPSAYALPAYLFGPLSNAPPAQPDAVLISVVYMMKSLEDLGMTYIHLSPDTQLYIQAMQIKWSDPQRFRNLILRPGVMHIVQNVCGCIGHLMTGSGLATLIGAAFGGVNSIIGQGKPRVRAMRSFRMASSILLHSFLQTGFRTWEEICEYMEKARLYPTGRHWVDNLITPPCLPISWCASPAALSFRTFSSRAIITIQGTIRGTVWRWPCSYLLQPRITGAFSCRHKAGSWNAVSAD